MNYEGYERTAVTTENTEHKKRRTGVIAVDAFVLTKLLGRLFASAGSLSVETQSVEQSLSLPLLLFLRHGRPTNV